MLVKGASARVLSTHEVRFPQLAEERRSQGSLDAQLQHAAVAEGRERTRLRTSVGADVEEAPSGCQAAAHMFLIARERDDNHPLVSLGLVPLHGFYTLGNEHLPVPRAFDRFPPYSIDLRDAHVESGTLVIPAVVVLGDEEHPSRLKNIGIANMGRNVSFKLVVPF